MSPLSRLAIRNWIWAIGLSSAFAIAAPPSPKFHHVSGFTGKVSGQKFGTNLIATDGSSLALQDDTPVLDALTEECAPNQWCRVSGWADSKGTLALIQSAERVEPGTPAMDAEGEDKPAVVVSRPAFNCARATVAVEMLICSSAELGELDARLAERYRAAKSHGATTTVQQAAWVKRRNECGSEKCVREAYRDRIDELHLPSPVKP